MAHPLVRLVVTAPWLPLPAQEPLEVAPNAGVAPEVEQRLHGRVRFESAPPVVLFLLLLPAVPKRFEAVMSNSL